MRCRRYARCYFRRRDMYGTACACRERHGWQCRDSRHCAFFIDVADVAKAVRARYVAR